MKVTRPFMLFVVQVLTVSAPLFAEAADEQDSLRSQLLARIESGKIIFDAPASTSERLRAELLRENSGEVKVSPKLQRLIVKLADTVPQGSHIRISSLLRSAGDSLHVSGHAVDIGNESIANNLLAAIATEQVVEEYAIDEIIFDASEVGHSDRNKWNYDRGRPHAYSPAVLDEHRDHIHFAVKEER